MGVDGVATGTFEFRIVRPDGATRVIYRENGLIFDENGKPTRLYGSYQDVTEQRSAETRERELERKLMHSQKLEALGTLAGGIAHDLNNTLTPIMALSKITARRLEPGSVLHANLETIFVASEQARDLVKRVLAFSRQDKIDKQPTDLGEVVTEALKLLRATIPTSIQIDARIDDVSPVLADRSQIHQVVTNLVSNAAQAIGDRMGTIAVTIEAISDGGQHEAIRLGVSDTGRGMDQGTRDRIFEPFFTTKEVGQGTGLGLSIVASIVADHGARVEVASEPGQGSRFDIYFPPLDESAAAAA
jgi:signal transduction histidine kinase